MASRSKSLRSRPARPLAALALAAAALPSCAGGDAPPEDARPNLILISIDTLRADRLSCYGYERKTSPSLDRFAEEAVLFEEAIAPSSWTIPSHFTLLTGLLPTTHGATLPTRRPGPGTALLSQILGAAGWHPFAITDGGWMAGEMGFGRGFREYEDERRGLEGVLARAREYVETYSGDVPYFAFLHTYDVHCPYDPEPPWEGRFRSPGATPIATEGRCGNPHYNALELTPGHARYLSDRYDESVRAADEALGEFFDFLRARGELERTVVVVTSDHGEEFLEHGRIGHEGTLFAESLRVPLIVRRPDGEAGRVTLPVSLADVAPTCLALLGVEIPPDLDGASLLGPGGGLDGAPARAPFVFSELDWNGRLRSWMGPELHLIQDLESGRIRLYDRARDPLEQRDVAEELPERARELAAELEAFSAALGARARPAIDAAPPAPGARVEELRRLGYVEGAGE